LVQSLEGRSQVLGSNNNKQKKMHDPCLHYTCLHKEEKEEKEEKKRVQVARMAAQGHLSHGNPTTHCGASFDLLCFQPRPVHPSLTNREIRLTTNPTVHLQHCMGHSDMRQPSTKPQTSSPAFSVNVTR
jgi:hypothetical protein